MVASVCGCLSMSHKLQCLDNEKRCCWWFRDPTVLHLHLSVTCLVQWAARLCDLSPLKDISIFSDCNEEYQFKNRKNYHKNLWAISMILAHTRMYNPHCPPTTSPLHHRIHAPICLQTDNQLVQLINKGHISNRWKITIFIKKPVKTIMSLDLEVSNLPAGLGYPKIWLGFWLSRPKNLRLNYFLPYWWEKYFLLMSYLPLLQEGVTDSTWWRSSSSRLWWW